MIATLAAMAAVSTTLLCLTNPVTAMTQLDLLGAGEELALGAQRYPAFIFWDSLGPIDDEALQVLASRTGGAVAWVSHRPALPYAYVAVHTPVANAFALPGGTVRITRGLLAPLDCEDGLAAVLGHEVGHVTARHVVAAYNRQARLQALGAA